VTACSASSDLLTRGHGLRQERVEWLLRFVDGAGASRDVFPWVTFRGSRRAIILIV
jgi:hypothetical protein